MDTEDPTNVLAFPGAEPQQDGAADLAKFATRQVNDFADQCQQRGQEPLGVVVIAFTKGAVGYKVARLILGPEEGHGAAYSALAADLLTKHALD